MLTYDDENHLYYWNDKPVPSLSEYLRANGWYRDLARIPQKTLELATKRGNEAHEAIAAYLQGEANYESYLSEDSVRYFESFLGGVDQLPITDAGVSELPIGGWCGYGTTPDRVEPTALIEFKTTYEVHPLVWIQLAGQEYALSPAVPVRGGSLREKMVAWLQKDGSPLKVVKDKNPETTARLFHNTVDQAEWKKAMRWK